MCHNAENDLLYRIMHSQKHNDPSTDVAAHFGIDRSLQDQLIQTALSRGGDYADIFFEYRVNSSILFEEDKVKNATKGILQGIGIRVIRGEQTGYSYTDELMPDRMIQAAQTASYIADVRVSAAVLPPHMLATAGLYPVQTLAVHESVRKKLDCINRANQAARDYHVDIDKVIISYSDEARIISFRNSEGVLYNDIQPMLRFNVVCIASRGSNRQRGYHGGGGRVDCTYFSQHTPEEYAVEAARQAIVLLDAVEAPAGPSEIVLGSASAGILLHEAVGHGLEADFNRKQLSNYSNRIGQKVASELCTIVDNGTLPYMRGSINMDDEGVRSRENILIENGILQTYMQDKISAHIMDMEPSGNGRRQSYKHPPMPRMTNTYLLPGPSKAVDMIRTVRKGIYAKAFGGGQVDIATGDFVFNITEGYKIEDGAITAPIKDAQLIGNGPEVMTKVTDVADDLEYSDGVWTCGKHGQSVPVGVGMPHVKVSEITVGGTDSG